MTYEDHAEEGRFVWCAGRVTYEVLVPVDGVVALGVFVDGKLLRVWDEPEGEG